MKSEMESTILTKDFKVVTEHISSSSSNIPVIDSSKPQNKLFTSLLNQMRKATKVISMLERHTKNLENKMTI